MLTVNSRRETHNKEDTENGILVIHRSVAGMICSVGETKNI